MDMIKVNPISQAETKWEISWDGYYPYCGNCNYEPSYQDVLAGLPDTCPECGAHMKNYKEMWLKNRKNVSAEVLAMAAV